MELDRDGDGAVAGVCVEATRRRTAREFCRGELCRPFLRPGKAARVVLVVITWWSPQIAHVRCRLLGATRT